MGINEGDIIRIGRTLTEQGISNIKANYNEGNFLIPTRINGDLFVSGNFQTKNMGIDEYLKTSILVSKTPFEIQLEPSNYTIAVLRKNKLVCLTTVNLKESEVRELTCSPVTQGEESGFEDETRNYYFDATLFPSSFLDSKSFQNWAFATSNNLLFSTPIFLQEDYFKKESEVEQKKQFTFIFQNSITKKTNFLPTSYSAVFPNELKANDLNQLYFGVTGDISSGYITSLRNNAKNYSYLGIPLGGEGEQNVALGAVPFSSFTKLTNIGTDRSFLQRSNIQASNGVIFNLFEPLPSPSNGGLLATYVQQRFRLRISIPPWNSTNVVEMYINGKIHRRWILDRGDISKAYSLKP